MSIETSACLALKKLDIDKKMVARKKDAKLSVANAMSAFKPATKTKSRRRKKVTVRMGKEYVEYLEKHPLPPPMKPVDFDDWILSDLEDSFIAQEKAAREAREKIIKQYKEQGYATREVEVSDDDDDEL